MATDPSHEAAAITLEKIAFELAASDWHGHATESVWAERTGTGLYRIRNVPFFARYASYGDVVRTRPGEPFPIVASVVERSGHSTYRVIAEADVFNQRWPTWKPASAMETGSLRKGIVGIFHDAHDVGVVSLRMESMHLVVLSCLCRLNPLPN